MQRRWLKHVYDDAPTQVVPYVVPTSLLDHLTAECIEKGIEAHEPIDTATLCSSAKVAAQIRKCDAVSINISYKMKTLRRPRPTNLLI